MSAGPGGGQIPCNAAWFSNQLQSLRRSDCQIFGPAATDWCKEVEPVLVRMLALNWAFFSTGFSTELLKSFVSCSAFGS
jgi:hypothetical protein